MKNIKLKHFAVALMMVLQWSCATTEIPQASEQISKNDLSGEGSMLNEYKTFKIDGVITSDTKKIKEMMNNSQVTIDNPEEKEISFYTSEASYRRFNPEDEVNERSNKNAKVAAAAYPDDFNDIGGFGADYAGISGLGTILDQGYFRNYANNIYFINTPSANGNKNFIRLPNLTNFDKTNPGMTVYASNGSVVKYDFSMSQVLVNIKSGGNVSCIVVNDTDNNRYLNFYENKNYGGRRYQLTITKDSYSGFAPTFSTIGGTCRSINSVTY